MKNYFTLAFALLFGLGCVHAQVFTISPQSVDKSVKPTNNHPLLDVTPPTISCLSDLQVNLMPTLMIQLWATDFLNHAEDNVTPSDQIRFGIRKAGTGTGFPLDPNGQPKASVLFDCDEQGGQSIELWAMDLAGNTSFCAAPVVIQDNFGHFCSGGNNPPGLITIHLKAGDNNVEGVDFQVAGIDSSGVPFQYFVQNDQGNITVPVGSSGTVTPVKDDNPLNGVTTYDMVLIGRHYKHTQPFIIPWQWIAADVNRDNVVDQQDSIECTKLILGYYQELPNNTSWRFVLSSYAFPLPDPLSQPFPESYTFNNIQTPVTVEFQAIKVGDVNGTAIANNVISGGSAQRGNQPGDVTIQAEAPGTPNDPPIFNPLDDTEPPTIVCINGISVNIMPTGMISLWATDFLQFVSDDVTPTNQIKLGIRKAGAGTGFPVGPNGEPNINVLYDCSELGTQTIELWAMDLAGNTSFCTTTLLVQDNLLNCSASGTMATLCTRQFCTDNGIEEAALLITADSVNFLPPFSFIDLSDNQGCWDIPNGLPVPLPSNAKLAPLKDDNPLNGVTSYDLVLLSKHIHGIQPFTEPWQWIAADANRDNVVDIQDSIEFSKLITGVYQELPNNTSWRFVRSDYVFPSPNPLSQPFPESIRYSELVDSVHVVFYGIKIGDLSVNCTQLTSETEPDNELQFRTILAPNPTEAGATLTFELNQAASVRLQVSDLTGRRVHDAAMNLTAGNQSLGIPEQAFPEPGIYIWNLMIGGKMVSGKLIRM